MEWTPTGWKDQRGALPETPQESNEIGDAFRALSQLIHGISREMRLHSPKASITMDPDFNLKEITIEGFIS